MFDVPFRRVSLHNVAEKEGKFSHIFFNQGYAYATDGVIIARSKFEDNGQDNMEDLLNNKMISAESYKLLIKKDAKMMLEYQNDELVIHLKIKEADFFIPFVTHADHDITAEKIALQFRILVQKLSPNTETEQCVNPAKLAKLASLFQSTPKIIHSCNQIYLEEEFTQGFVFLIASNEK